jgi:proline iminopeptidase
MGARLYYRVMGTGADTIVVVHGGPGAGMSTVLPDLKHLTRNHLIIFYDQRGGGRSTLPADTMQLQARYFIQDLEAVRQHFRLDRMNVVAHSFGPIIVAAYAQAHPNHGGSMVFLGATGPAERTSPPTMKRNTHK